MNSMTVRIGSHLVQTPSSRTMFLWENLEIVVICTVDMFYNESIFWKHMKMKISIFERGTNTLYCFCHHIIVTLQSMCQLWKSTNLFIISASLRKSIFSSTLLPSFNVFTATATLMKHWFEDQLREIQFNRFLSFNSNLHLFISTSPSADVKLSTKVREVFTNILTDRQFDYQIFLKLPVYYDVCRCSAVNCPIGIQTLWNFAKFHLQL